MKLLNIYELIYTYILSQFMNKSSILHQNEKK